jgi:CBS domain-containing protein
MLDRTCLSTIDDSVAYLAGSSLPPHKHSPVESPRRPLPPTARVRLTDRATHVVTDFTWEQPVTVTEDRPIDDALRDMILAGVRALLVVSEDAVTGLITSYDIQGERPLQFLLTSNYSRHDEIEVRHIMTLWEHVPRLDWRDICAARVTDIVKFFKSTGTTHVVLVEQTEHKGVFVRGIISRTRLVHQLGSSVYV